MDVDFSKKVCEATLGEFIAAERVVGIATAWASGLVGAGALVIGRLVYKRWQAHKSDVLVPQPPKL